jgi:hypothetical protein
MKRTCRLDDHNRPPYSRQANSFDQIQTSPACRTRLQQCAGNTYETFAWKGKAYHFKEGVPSAERLWSATNLCVIGDDPSVGELHPPLEYGGPLFARTSLLGSSTLNRGEVRS